MTKPDLEHDLRNTPWLVTKVRTSDSYAQNLYAALCNNQFQHNSIVSRLCGHVWSCSWRYAGGVVADIRLEGDYIDWYCSGMGGMIVLEGEPTPHNPHYVEEGRVTDEIREDLWRLGWIQVDQC
jgi:hypothetical protein